MMAVPFAMCALEEQQFLEQEREEKARMGAGEVLTGKGEGAGKGL